MKIKLTIGSGVLATGALSSQSNKLALCEEYSMSHNQIKETIKSIISGYQSDEPKAHLFNWWLTNYGKDKVNIDACLFHDFPSITSGHMKILYDDCIKHKVIPSIYKWSSGQGFVNFANRKFGGHIIEPDGGWVQEEFLTACLDIFPFVIDFRKKKYNKLDKYPAVFRTKALFEPNMKYYGGELYAQSSEVIRNPGQVLKLMVKPLEIYWISMAAINIGFFSPTIKNVEDMLKTSYRAYYTCMKMMISHKKPIIINTGNWGAGMFGWDVRSSYIIQYYGFNFAAHSIKNEYPDKIKKIQFNYYCFDANVKKEIESLDLSTFTTLDQLPKDIIDITD